MEAFDAALQHGCDGFEFDVRLTRDGHAVVCHNARSRGRWLAKSDFAKCAHLPRLEDVIGAFGRRAFLDIELKVRGMRSWCCQPSSNICPNAMWFLLSERGTEAQSAQRIHSANHLRPVASELAGTSGQLCHPTRFAGYTGLGRRTAQYRNACGVTVNDKATMLRLASWKVDGIISDKTDLL